MAETMAVTIREMTPADIPPVCDLMEQLTGKPITPEGMQSRLDFVAFSPFDWLYVAELGDRVVGVMGFRLREKLEAVGRHGEISVIVTDQRVRKQGVGGALMAYAEELALQHGCDSTWLVSGKARTGDAHPFYRGLGYEATGYRFIKMLDTPEQA